MERNLTYELTPEDGVFIARCLDVEVASDGPTEEDAVVNLQEALELYLNDHDVRLAPRA
ncbi:MAG: type II toxin-antitoxin system HicB family antitoxin [Gammaproteobacteria bacterium]|nr:type II toxin-antitoxin system HicB family antitoxin [Gammaproteobacteria bacterium]MBU1732499.1 type II toxin-antitoxin system HicB family antitoxin [Gammaproteobacteria bacterium]MBU1892635.1 type II toxin-antitoxin system HicB family antitoxin [Gammaproteobacteria bacterium]